MKRMLLVFFAAALVAMAAAPPVYGWASSGAVVVMEAETGRLLYSQNPHQQLPMASTTKIMTALLALETPGVDAPFVVDEKAIMVEGSSMGLQKGDTVTLRALAGGMLTASGNDAANAAAVRIAGSIPAFARLMNDRAAKLGLKDTHFVTPSGLDDQQHYSTAADMALLAREALENPDFLEMCSSRRLALEFGNPPYSRTLYNHNRLLERYEYAIGVKTGFTKTAGRCLVSAARKEDKTLIVVTLNCGDDWNVHENLYEQYFPLLTREQVPPPEGLWLPVCGGAAGRVSLAAEPNLSYTCCPGDARQVTFEVFSQQFAYAPIKKGDIMGKIVYYIDNELLGEAPLTAAEDISPAAPEQQSSWQRMGEKIDDWLFEVTG